MSEFPLYPVLLILGFMSLIVGVVIYCVRLDSKRERIKLERDYKQFLISMIEQLKENEVESFFKNLLSSKDIEENYKNIILNLQKELK